MTATLGIVGGIGPEATVDYYRGVLEQYRRRRPSAPAPAIVITSLDVTRVLRLAGTDTAALLAYLLHELHRLNLAGATLAIMAANTPHLVYDELARRSPVELLGIVDATATAAQHAGVRHVTLFGTRLTMEASFYPAALARAGIAVTVPSEAERSFINDRYLSELVRGEFREDTRTALLDIAQRLRTECGIDGLVLAGTELPLLMRQSVLPGVTMLDTAHIHVRAAVDRLCESPM